MNRRAFTLGGRGVPHGSETRSFELRTTSAPEAVQTAKPAPLSRRAFFAGLLAPALARFLPKPEPTGMAVQEIEYISGCLKTAYPSPFDSREYCSSTSIGELLARADCISPEQLKVIQAVQREALAEAQSLAWRGRVRERLEGRRA